MIFGPEGMLIIQYNFQNPIIFEKQDNEKHCSNEEKIISGNLEIQQLPEFHLQHDLKTYTMGGGNRLEIKSNLGDTKMNQKFMLIKYESSTEYYEQNEIGNAFDNVITTAEQIKQDYKVYNSKQTPNSTLIFTESSSTIIFKKQFIIKLCLLNSSNFFLIIKPSSCLSIKALNIHGVQFLNVKYLSLLADNIHNCIFKSDTHQDGRNTSIHLFGNVKNNVFIGFDNQEHIHILSNVFMSNVIFNSLDLHLIPNSEFRFVPSQNKVIKSKITFRLKEQIDVYLENNILKSSVLTINDLIDGTVYFLGDNFIDSQITINNNQSNLLIKNSIMTNSQLKLVTVNESIQILFSRIEYKEKSQTQNLITILMPPKNITISHSLVKGNFTKLIISEYFHSQITKVYLNKSAFDINNKFNQNISALFSLPYQKFTFQNDERKVYSQMHIKNYNQYSSQLLIPCIFDLPHETHMSLTEPSYYSIRHISFEDRSWSSDNVQIIMKQNNKYRENFDSSEPIIQILPYDSQQLQFTYKNKIINPHSFNITLYSNLQITKENLHLEILFPIESKAIQHIIACYTLNGNYLCKNIVSQTQVQLNLDVWVHLTVNNEIKVQWRQIIEEKVSLMFVITYCDENQFIQKGKCVEFCGTQKISGFLCEDNCLEGFIQVGSSTNNCQKCGNGCIDCCAESKVCSSCSQKLILDDGYCVTSCERGQYYSDNQCFNCIEDCNHCLEDYSHFYSPNCQQCDYMLSCPHSFDPLLLSLG